MDAFRDWIRTARAGQVYIYYTGDLANDRGAYIDWGDGDHLVFIASGDIDAIGTLAYDAFTSNQVHLFQRKIHDNIYQYIAMKRRYTGRHW